jgi:hypothetical protein
MKGVRGKNATLHNPLQYMKKTKSVLVSFTVAAMQRL